MALSRLHAFFERRSGLGILFAIVAYQESLTPSLLPRSWLAQGVISGLSVVVLYLLGTGLSRLAATMLQGPPPERVQRWRVVIGWAGVIALPVLLLLSIPGRQAEWRALGYDVTDHFLYLGVILVVVAVLVVCGLAIGGLRWLYRRVFRGVSKIVPLSIAAVVSALAVTLVTVLAVNEFAYSRFMDAINETRAGADTEIDGDEPADPRASDVVAWASLGREGRRFITRVPSVDDLERFSGRESMEPIRVFVGRASDPDFDGRAALAVQELERSGAFERSVLLIVTPTGTGWVNEQIVQPVEYFHAGDTATVAVQYSHLPSPVAFISEQHAAVDSARVLLDAVTARLDRMPEDERPLLLVAGESLGAFGGTGAFDNIDELVRRVDGSLWVGTPPMSNLRREAERRRDPGSLQIRPRIERLPELVVGGRESEFEETTATHAFLQFADDPIVWWDAGLLWRRPDWLSEPLDPRVMPGISWRPVTTFLQLTADQIVGTEFGEGWGHRYGTMPLITWFETLDPEGWDAARLAVLRTHLDEIADSFHGPVE
ncbi:alpha/beta-hydrolase family protein [Aeromicrobium sp. PE09-221]|uniref:alpha/beta-hydrolase family protein n=1 Tax=Aeromicrobium sp. PE09-221 TaxID=1898043 RepID=UPI001F2DFE86|nr:alpha/beta-hydrolase family protein [Aeromicrobium sp. PE09-221]